MITKFADPTLIEQMSLGEKISASLFITVLGMLITFAALVGLWGLTAAYSKIIRNAEQKKKEKGLKASTPAVKADEPKQEEQAPAQDDGELVAILAAAIAMATDKRPQDIIVRQIRRTIDATPAWGQAGRLEQMNSRL